MYFVIGWPQTLATSAEEDVHQIVPNGDQSIFLLLSADSLSLWYCRPVVRIVQYQRTAKSVAQYGDNAAAIWKSDSSQVVVQTTADYLLFYQVVISEDRDTILTLVEHNSSRKQSFSVNGDAAAATSAGDEAAQIPALILELQHVLHVTDGITCFMSAEEEIVISTKTGHLCGVEWDGKWDENFRLNVSIPPVNYHHHLQQQHSQSSKHNHHHHHHSTSINSSSSSSSTSSFSHIRDFKYSTIIGGFSLVFHNGLGAFLPLTAENSSTSKPNPSNTSNTTSSSSSKPPSQLQLISGVESALCTAINHKYALIAFGLSAASSAVLCGFDEVDRRFTVSHRLTLPAHAYPEVSSASSLVATTAEGTTGGGGSILGPVTTLQWTPDSAVLATAWANGGFALWTVFGSLLTCSLGWSYNSSVDAGAGDSRLYAGPYRVASLAFGKEGYHLWMATRRSADLFSPNSEDSSTETDTSTEANGADAEDGSKAHRRQQQSNWVCKLSLAKSVLAANPCSSVSVETVLLASEDRIFVGGNRGGGGVVMAGFAQLPTAANGVAGSSEDNDQQHPKRLNGGMTNGGGGKHHHPQPNASPSSKFYQEQESSNAVDSFQWITVPLPPSYLEANWPVRLFAIDPATSQNLAISGLNGLATYSLASRRWKLFGNENHERDFVVTGGFLWFADYIIAGCYNLVKDCYEIRAYSQRQKLDTANAKIISIEAEVVLLSLHQSRLLALCSNGAIFLFDLHLFTARSSQQQHLQQQPNGRMVNGDYSGGAYQQQQQHFSTELNISAPIRVQAANLEIFADCVTVCLLTDLHVDMYHSCAFQSESSQRSHLIQTSAVARSHSILLNMCGRVLLLEMDVDTTGLLPFSEEEEEEENGGDDFDDSEESEDEDHHHRQQRRPSMQRQLSADLPPNSSSSSSSSVPRRVNGDYEPSTIKYRKAVKLASNVENLWILPHDDATLNQAFSASSHTSSVPTLQLQQLQQQQQQLRPHLVTSLYLSCGAQGMAVWLSLEHSLRQSISSTSSVSSSSSYPQVPSSNIRQSSSSSSNNYQQQQHNAYISKRIMLPIREIANTIYPLAIRFREAIVLGAESDFTHPNSFSLNGSSTSSTSDRQQQQPLYVPFCVVKRTSQVYLHYVLRELLRRNLGYRAWEIANTCTALPHFVHSLELLLHGVLEEEASSSQPIPDALLPRVVEFIRAFPVFLQTVINCARKTEYARWPHLFSVVGSPRDLFAQCLLEGQLETASGYIIVLHNLEKPEVATRCASRLLQAARLAGSWVTVKELKRFLRSTNGDGETAAAAAEVQQQQTLLTSPRVSESAAAAAAGDQVPDEASSKMANNSEQPPSKVASEVITTTTTTTAVNTTTATTANLPGTAITATTNSNGLHHQLSQQLSLEEQQQTPQTPAAAQAPKQQQQQVPPQPRTNGQKAYPGSIRRLTSSSHPEPVHPNAPFHFLAASLQHFNRNSSNGTN